MLAKCSNPSCSVAFRHLQEGRLFRLESDPVIRTGKTARMEHFWLCDRCSSTMILSLGEDETVLTVPVREPTLTYLLLSILFRQTEERGCCSVVFAFRYRSNFEIARDDYPTKTMPHDREQREDVIAAGTTCPMPDCGALAIAYRSTEDVPMTTQSRGTSRAPVADSSLLFQKAT